MVRTLAFITPPGGSLMITLVIGIVIGAVAAVAIPAVYNFVAKQYASVKAKV